MRMSVLGIPIDVVNMQRAVGLILEWAAVSTKPRMIFVRDVASLMLARSEPKLRALHDQAALVVPDGMPLVWIGRLRGLGDEIGRVAGSDLVDAVCSASQQTSLRHFFYGGKPGVADEMARKLQSRFPELTIVGTMSPPMREIHGDYAFDTAARTELQQLREAAPDVVWVGLSSPKQEYWMAAASKELQRGVLLGVGAAFDFQSGAVKRAPLWMRARGLEWLYRLLSEPRRLYRRYLILAPQFVWLLAKQAIRDRFRHRGVKP